MKLFEYNKYLNKVIQSIRETASRKNRKKSNNEKNEEKKCIKIKILYYKEYSRIQKQVLQILRKEYNNENNKISLNNKNKDEILSNNEIEQNLKTKMLEFAAFKAKEVESIGLEALNEKFAEYNENYKPKGCKDAAIPGKPLVIQL